MIKARYFYRYYSGASNVPFHLCLPLLLSVGNESMVNPSWGTHQIAPTTGLSGNLLFTTPPLSKELEGQAKRVPNLVLLSRHPGSRGLVGLSRSLSAIAINNNQDGSYFKGWWPLSTTIATFTFLIHRSSLSLGTWSDTSGLSLMQRVGPESWTQSSTGEQMAHFKVCINNIGILILNSLRPIT